MATPQIRKATAKDAQSIQALLEHNGLPTSDLAAAMPEFVVADDHGTVIGTGALQRFEGVALLRSVAVAAERRSCGTGRLIVQELERLARVAHIPELVLLTQTAKTFFEHQGYRVIDRRSAPGAVQTSEEFRSLCPASATCMAKTLASIS
jgi:amino-acid N-acetyltransferase